MKQITLVNTDETMTSALQEYYEVVPEISNNILIDWYNPKQNIEQVTILEEAIKQGANILLFDRYLTLKTHEVDWLLRYKNVHLFEPCLVARRGFKYMPFWYKFSDDWVFDYDDKNIDIAFFQDPNRNEVKHDIPVVTSLDYVKMTILYCHPMEYERGYLPDMSICFQSRCVPLLPFQHKYFWSLFPGLVINDKKDIDWCLNVLRLYDAVLYGITDTIRKSFPEMLVENVAEQIVQTLKGV